MQAFVLDVYLPAGHPLVEVHVAAFAYVVPAGQAVQAVDPSVVAVS